MFANKWDFLFARVLVGIDRSTGVWSGTEPAPGQQMVCVWSSEAIATEALHVESWELKWIDVRELLTLIPDGVGVVVDPERPDGMTASPAQVAQLKSLTAPFPPDAPLRVTSWDELTGSVLDAIVAAAADSASVREVRAFVYTVDESPALGCLAYSFADQADEQVLVAARELVDGKAGECEVKAINVLDWTDVPSEVRSALPDDFIIYPRKRRGPRLWRR